LNARKYLAKMLAPLARRILHVGYLRLVRRMTSRVKFCFVLAASGTVLVVSAVADLVSR